MRRSVIFCRLPLFLLFIVLFSCGGNNQLHDLDNTIEDAVPINPGATVEVKVNHEGNQNWFKVDAPGQGYLRVSVQNDPEDVNLTCYFAHYEEWEGKKENRISGYLGLPAIVKAEEGTFYFVIKDRYDKGYSDEVIPMKVEFIEEFDPHEVNDQPQDARLLEVNSSFETAVFPAGDVNWFKVQADTAGIIRLMAREIPGDMNLVARFYEYDEWASPEGERISDQLSVPCGFAVHQRGEYYFTLKDRYDNKYARELIPMRVDFEKQIDPFEPNNTFQEAKELDEGQVIDIAIYPKGDVDYFKITPAAGGTLSIKPRGAPQDLNLVSRLLLSDPDDPSSLINYSGIETLPARFEVEGGREYYFYIKDRYDQSYQNQLFEVMVDME